MENLNINCEYGCRLTIDDIQFKGDSFSAQAIVKSDWYEAKVSFDSSIDRLSDFLQEVKVVLFENQGKANYINDEGNFDLDIVLDGFTGTVQMSGVLIKNMMDESRLEYYMETDYQSLEKLKDNLNSLLS